MQYAQKRLISGLFCIFMVSVIIFNSYERKVYADAGTIAIAGGSMAVGGLGAGALAGLGGPVVVAVMLAGLAFGVNIELTKASEEAGMTKTEFLKSKINQYCSEAQISASTFNSYVLEQMTILNDGRISLSNQACKQIKQFYNWLFDTDQVVQSTFTGTTVNILGKSCPVVRMGNTGSLMNYDYENSHISFTYTYSEGNIPLVLFRCNLSGASNEIYAVTKENITSGDCVFLVKYGDTIAETNSTANQLFGYHFVSVFYSEDPYFTYTNDIPVFTGMQLSDVLGQLNGEWPIPVEGVTSGNVITGDKPTYDNNSDVLNPSDNQTTIINPGLVGTLPIPADKDLTIDVQAYLEALQKILDKLNDITIPAVDDATGIPIDIDVDDTDVLDPTIEKEDDTDLPSEDDKTPVINDNPVDPTEDPILATEPLKFDLRNIFPFCIPFDVKDMLNKLNSEPVAPRYTVNWHIPIVNQNLVFTVDLSCFDSVAVILRKMELIAFVIGLAVITRSMFIRG